MGISHPGAEWKKTPLRHAEFERQKEKTHINGEYVLKYLSLVLLEPY